MKPSLYNSNSALRRQRMHPSSSRLGAVLLYMAAIVGPVARADAQTAPSSPAAAGSSLPLEVIQAMETIQGGQIVAHAAVLCDPKFAGREAGASGARLAAEYVAEQFRRLGLRPGGNAGSYFQTFKIRAGYHISSVLTVSKGASSLGEFRRGEDYMPVHLPGGNASMTTECALVGYGISSTRLQFDDYDGVDATGKAVLVFSGVPWTTQASHWIRRLDNRRFDTLAYKARNAADHGAVLMLLVENPTGWRQRLAIQEELRLPDTQFPIDSPIPIVHVTQDLASELTGLSPKDLRLLANGIVAKRKSASRILQGRQIRYAASIEGSSRIGRNVIGILPGSDGSLAAEAVVIGAHYDHLGEGVKGIFFGANDNAAGVGAVLEAARAFVSLPEPFRRSVVLIAFGAEEIGRLGSSHYVSHPSISIDRTVLMINFDMIGRNDEDHIHAVGTLSSPEVHAIHQEMNAYVGLRIEHPLSFRLGRSDHTAFYRAGIPIMYLFGGRHVDYNTPQDTVDKLSSEKLEMVARLAFLTAWEVAGRSKRITFVPDPNQ